MTKIRIDQLLVDKGITDSRNKSKNLIEKGHIFVNGEQISKASKKIDQENEIEIKGIETLWVARSYKKLLHALNHWRINVENLICLDIGASTGGFTQVLLNKGAKKVYALDVGHNQLHESLKNSEKVENIEGFNAKEINENTIPEKVDFISMDISFISIKYIIPLLAQLLKENGQIVSLFKPQFEVGKKYVDKNGIVKNKIATEIAIEEVQEVIQESDLKFKEIIISPIKGSKGNKEYLLWIKN